MSRVRIVLLQGLQRDSWSFFGGVNLVSKLMRAENDQFAKDRECTVGELTLVGRYPT